MYKRFWFKDQILFMDCQRHIAFLSARKYTTWVVHAMHPILARNFSSALKRLCLLLTYRDTPAKNWYAKRLSLDRDVLSLCSTRLYLLTLTPLLWFLSIKTTYPCSWQTSGRSLLPGARQATRRSRWQLWAEGDRNPEEKAVWEVMSTRANLYFND